MNCLCAPACLLVALVPCLAGTAHGDIIDDLRLVGVPADSAAILDTAIVIGMEGSLAEGDTLLKRYGGIVFTVVDSILAGWPVMGICVDIPGSRLRLTEADLASALSMMGEGWADDRLASWILDHTRTSTSWIPDGCRHSLREHPLRGSLTAAGILLENIHFVDP